MKKLVWSRGSLCAQCACLWFRMVSDLLTQVVHFHIWWSIYVHNYYGPKWLVCLNPSLKHLSTFIHSLISPKAVVYCFFLGWNVLSWWWNPLCSLANICTLLYFCCQDACAAVIVLNHLMGVFYIFFILFLFLFFYNWTTTAAILSEAITFRAPSGDWLKYWFKAFLLHLLIYAFCHFRLLWSS